MDATKISKVPCEALTTAHHLAPLISSHLLFFRSQAPSSVLATADSPNNTLLHASPTPIAAGFSSLANAWSDSPELVSETINNIFSSAINEVHETDGEVINFAGDALICR